MRVSAGLPNRPSPQPLSQSIAPLVLGAAGPRPSRCRDSSSMILDDRFRYGAGSAGSVLDWRCGRLCQGGRLCQRGRLCQGRRLCQARLVDLAIGGGEQGIDSRIQRDVPCGWPAGGSWPAGETIGGQRAWPRFTLHGRTKLGAATMTPHPFPVQFDRDMKMPTAGRADSVKSNGWVHRAQSLKKGCRTQTSEALIIGA